MNIFNRFFSYELGEIIDDGYNNIFYSIKGKKKLGVKISKHQNSKQKVLDSLNKEFEIGNYLNRKKIPTPKFIGIIDIFNPKKKEFESGLVIEIKKDCVLIKIIEFNSNSNNGIFFYSDDFEIVMHKDNNIISEDSLDFKFKNNVKIAICETLNTMIKNLKIPKKDLVKKLRNNDFQGLYSESSKIFYLIDFEYWINFL